MGLTLERIHHLEHKDIMKRVQLEWQSEVNLTVLSGRFAGIIDCAVLAAGERRLLALSA